MTLYMVSLPIPPTALNIKHSPALKQKWKHLQLSALGEPLSQGQPTAANTNPDKQYLNTDIIFWQHTSWQDRTNFRVTFTGAKV